MLPLPQTLSLRPREELTSEGGAEFPHRDAAFSHKLADADLQEEHGHSPGHQAYRVGEQKRS